MRNTFTTSKHIYIYIIAQSGFELIKIFSPFFAEVKRYLRSIHGNGPRTFSSDSPKQIVISRKWSFLIPGFPNPAEKTITCADPVLYSLFHFNSQVNNLFNDTEDEFIVSGLIHVHSTQITVIYWWIQKQASISRREGRESSLPSEWAPLNAILKLNSHCNNIRYSCKILIYIEIWQIRFAMNAKVLNC